uniref:ZP domain-containing protein n=1 Tax=Plectus sambesii TaxID=2011161 RepID=A0A914WWE9_9BILA
MTEDVHELDYFLIYSSGATTPQPLDDLKTANDNLLNGKGWISAKNCAYPQRLVIKLAEKSRVRKIQILVHQYLTPQAIHFYKNSDDDDLHVDAVQNIDFVKLGVAEFKNSAANTRELKTVFLDDVYWFMKLVIHAPFDTTANPHKQCGVLGLKMFGTEVDRQSTTQRTSRERRAPVDAIKSDKQRRISLVAVSKRLGTAKARRLLQKNYAAQLMKIQSVLKEKAKTADKQTTKLIQVALDRLDTVYNEALLLLKEETVAFGEQDEEFAEACEKEIKQRCDQAYEDTDIYNLLDANELNAVGLDRPRQRQAKGWSKVRSNALDAIAAAQWLYGLRGADLQLEQGRIFDDTLNASQRTPPLAAPRRMDDDTRRYRRLTNIIHWSPPPTDRRPRSICARGSLRSDNRFVDDISSAPRLSRHVDPTSSPIVPSLLSVGSAANNRRPAPTKIAANNSQQQCPAVGRHLLAFLSIVTALIMLKRPSSANMTIQESLFVITILISCAMVDAMSNSIMGLPEIQCDSSRIRISIRTQRPFAGRVFLKGNSHRPECVTDFTEHPQNNDSRLQVAIDYNLCNTERIRQLSPAGVTYANSLIVQFHPRFITAGDKAYHLRCFYSEVEHTVTSRFDVSQIPTDAVEQDMQMPQCGYTVRRGTANGPLVRHARVGDEVVHRWECSGNGDSFGMLIHSCFVEDDAGERTAILDEHGCTMDEVLLPHLTYNSVLDLAYSQARVFKYPDNSFVYFRCQIRICSKIDNGCEGIVPPRCDFADGNNSTSGRRTRSVDSSRYNRTANIDVVTKEMLVLEEGTNQSDSLIDETSSVGRKLSTLNSLPPRRRETAMRVEDSIVVRLCTNKLFLTSIFISLVMMFGSSVAFIIYLMIKDRQKHF